MPADIAWRAESNRLWTAIRAEIFKVNRRRMTYILLGALGALILLFYILLWLRIRDGPSPRRNGFIEWLALKNAMAFTHVNPYGLGLERFFATIICVVFAGTMMGNEFDWRTIGPVMAKGIRRWHFLAAKTLISVLFTIVAVTLGFLVAAAASAWFSNLYSLPFGSIGPAILGAYAASIGRTVLVVLPFVLFAVLCATLWRSAGQAVGAALGVYFMEGIFTGLLTNARGWIAHVPDALLNVNGDAIMRANGLLAGDASGPFAFGSGDAPLWRAALILLAWMTAFVALAFWWFHRRDIQE